MPKVTTASPYNFTARSRKDMTAAILSNGGRYDRHEFRGGNFALLAYNVKGYYANLSLDNLLKIWDERKEHELTPQEIDAVISTYNEYEQDLYDAALESARLDLTDSDIYQMDYNGTLHSVEWVFAGRSGGYAVPLKIDHITLIHDSRAEAEDYLLDLPFDDLRTLYRLSQMWTHDLTPEDASEAIEYAAAFDLVVNFAGIL